MYRSPDGKDVWKLSAFFFFCRMSESTRAGRAHFPCSVLDSGTEGGEARIVGLKLQVLHLAPTGGYTEKQKYFHRHTLSSSHTQTAPIYSGLYPKVPF